MNQAFTGRGEVSVPLGVVWEVHRQRASGAQEEETPAPGGVREGCTGAEYTVGDEPGHGGWWGM